PYRRAVKGGFLHLESMVHIANTGCQPVQRQPSKDLPPKQIIGLEGQVHMVWARNANTLLIGNRRFEVA
ncbi:MAG: hypothetical protein ABI164_11905, partial [Acidobacteriaceae bacterium]